MRKTPQQKTALLSHSVSLIRIELLESRTLLSATPAHHYGVPVCLTERPSRAPIKEMLLNNAAVAVVSTPSAGASDPADFGIPAGPGGVVTGVVGISGVLPLVRSGAWHDDGHGDLVLPGGTIDITNAGNGTSSNQNTQVVPGGQATTPPNSGDCPEKNKQNGGTAKPQLQHPGQGGASSGTQGSSAATSSDGSGDQPVAGPIFTVDPSIVRPTSPTTDASASAGPTVTPLAMTPVGPNAAPVSSGVPTPTVVSVPTTSGSAPAAAFAASNVSPVGGIHELPHTADHWYAALAVVAPPMPIGMAMPAAQATPPIQIASGAISSTAPEAPSADLYVLNTATPSLPARIAYNFVRLDSMAFHDSAQAFAAELAALNVVNSSHSHRRAWAITAAVLGMDVALVTYWHRKGKLRKQKQILQVAV